MQAGNDALGDDPGPETTRRAAGHASAEDQLHLARPADVEVFSTDRDPVIVPSESDAVCSILITPDAEDTPTLAAKAIAVFGNGDIDAAVSKCREPRRGCLSSRLQRCRDKAEP
jgi:hypothetical protein